MKVNTEHPQFTENFTGWRKIRDTLIGARAIKAAIPDGAAKADTVYLPRLDDQTPNEYRDYQARATFVNYSNRALTAWGGILFRKPVVLGRANPMMEADADMQGRTFQRYVEMIGEQVLSVGRAGTLVDWNMEEARPYLAYYPTESVLNWRFARIRGRYALVLLVLTEERPVDENDRFSHDTETVYRVYERLEKDVVVSVYKIVEGEEVLMEQTFPTKRGKPLMDIPFVFHSAVDLCGGCVGPAPIENIVEVNLSHFRNTADLENGRHLVGVPTPVVCGFDIKGDLKIGPNASLVSPDAAAHAEFMEFSGSGLSELRLALEEKEKQMAMLGARAITPDVGGAEATETVQLRATAESASLVDIAQALEVQFNDVVRWFEFWTTPAAEGRPLGSDTASVTFNRDFITLKMQPDEVTALVQAVISGKLSFDSYFYQLQQGEIYPDGWTIENEREAIEASLTMGMPQPPQPANPANPGKSTQV